MDDETLLKIVEGIAGENGRKIISLLLSSGSSKSDEEISDELNLRVNDVRRILYDLANHGFVAYSRSTKSDTRWHTYSWFTNKEMILQAINKRKREVIRILEEWLSYGEANTSYICPHDYTLYTFDDAFENNFRCLKCGSDLIELDNSKVVSYIKQVLNILRSSV